jgi:uncharacterized protein YjbI with pentapeptide repeats
MANQEHLDILKQGARTWNRWRQTFPGIVIDLSYANLRKAFFNYPYEDEDTLEQTMDLSNANLREINLSGCRLIFCNFRGADLSNANLSDTDLTSTSFRGANLSGANLTNANIANGDEYGTYLNGANLSGAILSGVTLCEANCSLVDLRGAILNGAIIERDLLNNGEFTNINFDGVDLSRIDLSGINLSSANLSGAIMSGANLSQIALDGVSLKGVDLRGANLSNMELSRCDFSEANLSESNLSNATLINAVLMNANLSSANLSQTNFNGANLNGANLSRTTIIETNLEDAILTNCLIYGIAAWGVNLKGAKQENLIITPSSQPTITVDNLKVAQFLYLLLHNEEIRDVIDTIAKKAVLILGRFTPERKAVLDAIRDELRKNDYLPILFDFDKPTSRDIHETITTLARLARFIIADITNPKSIPQELVSIVESLPSLPIQPLLKGGSKPWGMYDHIKRYPWVLPIYRYTDEASLLEALRENVIAPAEQKARELNQS